MTIDRFDDAQAMAEETAGFVAQGLAAALSVRSRALFVATGGGTVGPIYDLLSRVQIDWSRVDVTLTDERWVEVTDADSNERLVRERLLVGEAAKASLIGLRGTETSLDLAAQAAANRLAALPPADVVMAGMGEDGHFASLFPGSPVLELGLDPDGPACIAVPPGEGRAPPQPRLSLAAWRLTSAHQILLPITGAEKLRVAELALAGAEPEEFPVAALLGHGDVRFLWSP